MKKSLLGALLASLTWALMLTGCASWDNPTDVQTQNSELADSLQASGDPHAATGVARVDNLTEVEPLTDDPKPALPVELTDADGYDVTVTDTSRILALDLYGTYTKTLRGLGFSENIVGRTVSSDEDSLKDLPVVTEGGHTLNPEAVLNLKPTLVIVDHSIGPQEAIDQIRDAGVTTVVMQPERKMDSIGQDIRDLSAVVGVPTLGNQLAERTEKELEQAREAIAKVVPDEPLRMSFLYARGTGGVFYLLGDENHTKDLIEALGGVDVNTQQGIGAPSPASPEALAKVNPEMFIMMNGGLTSTGEIDGLLQRPGVAQTQAGKNKRVLTLPDGDSLAYGPQTPELLLRAAHALYGEG
ncbi:heme/hemin ABC transporter substrate-binding protein [Corynebacterium aquatimens]|uniref:Iron complex transport system substrate-binding protein n=1 Tax=Corynebacterium aquatimens TaxID=1190508 RepID=A0A931DTJ2_9CORY|nr:ABC transporter substrate-binding protein [Corynebacterium aquatimens]MBG6121164.1 iron complex transport system substrate-binding protein [Corynebacterium aquatimens]WJY66281.1 Hemin-binding periplasmic protein HmuT precursor [Corynebacterium aquatimens]